LNMSISVFRRVHCGKAKSCLLAIRAQADAEPFTFAAGRPLSYDAI
jgi:hypothetical protein